MSQRIAKLMAASSRTKFNRNQMLALVPQKEFLDGRTKQSFKDECDINLIMQRAAQGGTITHLQKYQGTYSDFSDFDFFEQTRQLTKGREIFDELPAEIRREFAQSPAAFFSYVNDPENINRLSELLPGLAKPGTQLIQTSPPDADQAASAAASELPASEPSSPPPPEPTPDP